MADFLCNFALVMRRLALIILAGACLAAPVTSAQNVRKNRMEAVMQAVSEQEEQDRAARKAAANGGGLMHYMIEDGDTVYIDQIPPVWVFPKGVRVKGTDWRKYYKLVYNFNKVYPYALLGRKLVSQVDAELGSGELNRIQKEKLINNMQNQLLTDFEDAVRHMTVSQGKLLVRLVDREIGKSPYNIVKDYKNGIAAKFWQGVARLFGQDLKKQYDPQGEDRMTEYLVQKWESGEFDALYFSIFMEMPKRTVIPSKYE